MIIRHPRENKEFSDRNELLQNSLRPETLPFNIASEYPTILNKENASTSYCMYNAEDKIIAHASLLIRDVVDKDNNCIDQIGLIGNVATCQQHRGKGHMSTLLKHLEMKAKEYHLSGLILWSDLGKFYQNLGYESLGIENRVLLRRTVNALERPKIHYVIEMNPRLQAKDLAALLDMRLKTGFTLHRSIDTFKDLLTIPYCDIFTIKQKHEIKAFFILGKGYDMMGVIHEWGRTSDRALNYLLDAILKELHGDDILMLSPEILNLDLDNVLMVEQNKHQMAWIRYIADEKKALYNNSFFIWGLDSI
jgi:predicted acetyltransferase